MEQRGNTDASKSRKCLRRKYGADGQAGGEDLIWNECISDESEQRATVDNVLGGRHLLSPYLAADERERGKIVRKVEEAAKKRR